MAIQIKSMNQLKLREKVLVISDIPENNNNKNTPDIMVISKSHISEIYGNRSSKIVTIIIGSDPSVNMYELSFDNEDDWYVFMNNYISSN